MISTDSGIDDKYPILRYFLSGHLEADLMTVSMPFQSLARRMAAELPYCPETSTALRKLLEAKDCAVRAALDAKRGIR